MPEGGGGSAKRIDNWKRMHMSLRVSIEFYVFIYVCIYTSIRVCRVCIYIYIYYRDYVRNIFPYPLVEPRN